MNDVPSPSLLDHYNRLGSSFALGLLRLTQARVVALTTVIALHKFNLRPRDSRDPGAFEDVIGELQKVSFSEYDAFHYVSDASYLVYATTLVDTFLSDTTRFLLLLHPRSIGENHAVSLKYAASLSYEIAPGPSPSIAFPRGGPFDAQHGYPRLGDFSRRLASAGYPVAEQARQSAGTIRFVRWGVTPPYREPAKKESALKKAREVIAVGEIIGSNPSPATQKDDGVAAIRPANPFRLPRNYPEIRFACSAPTRGALGGRGGGDVVNGVRAKPSESSAQKKAAA